MVSGDNGLATVPGPPGSILTALKNSVRFSTSIVIIKILFENGLVGSDLYSVIIASSMAFKFIVPVLFANLLVRWKVAAVRQAPASDILSAWKEGRKLPHPLQPVQLQTGP